MMSRSGRRSRPPVSVVAVGALALLVVMGGLPLAEASAPAPTCSTCAPPPVRGPVAPPPDVLDAYEVAAGVETLDPAVAYSAVSAEPLLNIYQTLIAYGGNDAGAFVPELATCVPGSVGCVHLYGSPLVENGTGGATQFFTFALDPAARFYDSKTGAAWPVYPSDVLFSFARLESFANLPYPGSTAGWVVSQALLPNGNASWDDGIHTPYNNTPRNVLSSILVNDSEYCPTAALAANGCVTFDADGSGTDWPFLLSLLAGPYGTSIVPCGWFSFVGAGIPGFTGTNAPYGDGPCLLPGGTNRSTSPAFQSFLDGVPPTLWDGVQLLPDSNPIAPQPPVQWTAVGSGPYYLGSVDPSTGYILRASPVYQAPSGCAGTPGCEPLAGTYFATVNVFYESNDTVGVQQYHAGRAAIADIGWNDTSAFDTLESAGKIGNMSVPALETNFQTYNLNFSVANENRSDPTGLLNVPGDFFSYNGLREFLSLAYPYAALQATLETGFGVPFGIDYGGAIPRGLGNEYPMNISWPSGAPGSNASVVGSAAWYWAAAIRPSSALYDPELSRCFAARPCRFPIMYPSVLGGPDWGPLTVAQLGAWRGSIANLSGGALEPYLLSPTCGGGLNGGCSPDPGQSPYTTMGGEWGSTYADASHIVDPMYAPNASYAYSDSVDPELGLPQFDNPTCGYDGGSWGDLLHWANVEFLPTACQGVAYDAMATWISIASALAPGPYRTLVYNEIEHVANVLALYVYAYQDSDPQTYASWIEPTSLSTNPMIGGEGIETWYSFHAVAPPPPTSYPVTFHELGLPRNATWSVSLNGSTVATSTASIAFDLPNGTYEFSIQEIGGYSLSPSGGTVQVNGTALEIWAEYVPAPTTYLVQFIEEGLPAGTSWSVTLNGSREVAASSAVISFSLPNGTYSYTVATVRGYSVSTRSGVFWVNAQGQNISIDYTPVITTYELRFQERGLPPGTGWSVSIGSIDRNTSTTSIEWNVLNGTYAFVVGSIGFQATPTNGTVSIAGSSGSVNVSFVANQTVLAHGSGWFGGLPAWAWAAVGSAGVAAAIGIGWVLLRPGRREAAGSADRAAGDNR